MSQMFVKFVLKIEIFGFHLHELTLQCDHFPLDSIVLFIFLFDHNVLLVNEFLHDVELIIHSFKLSAQL